MREEGSTQLMLRVVSLSTVTDTSGNTIIMDERTLAELGCLEIN